VNFLPKIKIGVAASCEKKKEVKNLQEYHADIS
jgi:hypothetical protein